MAFDISKYQTVKERKDLFSADHPSGVILAVPQRVTDDEATFTVALWEDSDSYVKGLDALTEVLKSGAQISDLQALLVMGPHALGTAYEARWMAMASKTSWTENAEESAIGRCLDNAGYHGSGKCSREEILKAKEAEKVLSEEDPFGDKALDVYSEARPIVEGMAGKQGVKELRQFFGHCSVAGMDWSAVVSFAGDQGVNLFGGLTKVSCIKLRDMAKQSRLGVA